MHLLAASLAATLALSAAETTSPAPPAAKPATGYQQREGKATHGAKQGTAASGKAAAGKNGNPADLKAYSASLLDPKRDAWQMPAEVVKALGLKPGQVACDVGAGPGYFTLRLAEAVGPEGRVYAVDVEQQLLATLRDRAGKAKLKNVVPVLGQPDDPLLQPGSCDVVLIVDTFHHFPDGVAYLWRLTSALKPGGRIVNVDFQKRETPVGPPVAHRVSREEFLAFAASAGLVPVAEETFLPHQYLIALGPKPAP